MKDLLKIGMVGKGRRSSSSKEEREMGVGGVCSPLPFLSVARSGPVQPNDTHLCQSWGLTFRLLLCQTGSSGIDFAFSGCHRDLCKKNASVINPGEKEKTTATEP